MIFLNRSHNHPIMHAPPDFVCFLGLRIQGFGFRAFRVDSRLTTSANLQLKLLFSVSPRLSRKCNREARGSLTHKAAAAETRQNFGSLKTQNPPFPAGGWGQGGHVWSLRRCGENYFFAAEMELTVIVSPWAVPFTVVFSPAYLLNAALSPFNLYILSPTSSA